MKPVYGPKMIRGAEEWASVDGSTSACYKEMNILFSIPQKATACRFRICDKETHDSYEIELQRNGVNILGGVSILAAESVADPASYVLDGLELTHGERRIAIRHKWLFDRPVYLSVVYE